MASTTRVAIRHPLATAAHWAPQAGGGVNVVGQD